MRRAISNVSSRQGQTIAMEICSSLRQIEASFQRIYIPYSMFGFPKDLHSKIEVMKTSVAKVENACYNVVVRGSERPDGWDLNGQGDNKRERDGDGEGEGRGKRQKFDQD
jgi:Translin family